MRDSNLALALKPELPTPLRAANASFIKPSHAPALTEEMLLTLLQTPVKRRRRSGPVSFADNHSGIFRPFRIC